MGRGEKYYICFPTHCKIFPKKELDRRSDIDSHRYGPMAQNFRQNLNLYPWQGNLCLHLSVSLVLYYMKDIKVDIKIFGQEMVPLENRVYSGIYNSVRTNQTNIFWPRRMKGTLK